MDKKESFELGIVFMIISATALAFTGFLGQLGMKDFYIPAMIFWRFIAAFILYGVYLAIRRELKHLWPVRHLWIHLARAFFILTAQYTFYYYIQKTNLLNAVVLLNTGPLFIPLVEWGLLRNKIGKSTWISIGVAFVGVLCVLQPHTGIFSYSSFIGLSAGVCQAFSQVLLGRNVTKEKETTSILYLFFFCLLFSTGPYIYFHKLGLVGNHLGWTPLWLVLGLGVASIFNQTTRAMAYKHGGPSKLSPFLYFSVLVAGILDWVVFHITPNLLAGFGAGVIIVGGVLKVILRYKAQPKV